MRLLSHVAWITIFSKAVHCLVSPCCFSSSRSASLLSPKTGIIYLFEFKNLTSTSKDLQKATSAFKREAEQCLVAKSLPYNHLALEALTAVRT